jgi:hypothetical protein
MLDTTEDILRMRNLVSVSRGRTGRSGDPTRYGSRVSRIGVGAAIGTYAIALLDPNRRRRAGQGENRSAEAQRLC